MSFHPRLFHFASLKFAHEGTTLDDQDWHKRRTEMLDDLVVDLPVLQHLKASRLDSLYTILNGEIKINFVLIETSQQPLGFTQEDLFKQDVVMLKNEQHLLPETYSHALKSSDDPGATPSLIDKRKRLSRSKNLGFIELPVSADFNHRLELPDLPKILNLASTSTLTGTVKRLEQKQLRLELTRDYCPASFHRLALRAGKVLTIQRRTDLRSEIALVRLAKALDSGSSVSLAVKIEISWVDGLPKNFLGSGFAEADQP